jgi:hypothetical protein
MDADAHCRAQQWETANRQHELDAVERTELEELVTAGGNVEDSPGLRFMAAELSSHQRRRRNKPRTTAQTWTTLEHKLASEGNPACLLALKWNERRRSERQRPPSPTLAASFELQSVVAGSVVISHCLCKESTVSSVRDCLRCGADISDRGHLATYCSNACRNLARRARHSG